MSYIDWNIAKKPTRGNNVNFSKHAKIYYRDGKGSVKTATYNISFYEGNAPDSFLLAEKFNLGSDGDNIYLSTNIRGGMPVFNILQPASGDGRAYKCNGKDMVTKIIKTMTGINPKGDVSAEFNLREVGDSIYKIVDFKII